MSANRIHITELLNEFLTNASLTTILSVCGARKKEKTQCLCNSMEKEFNLTKLSIVLKHFMVYMYLDSVHH